MPALTKRLTSEDTLQAHPGSFQSTVSLDSLPRVFRARRLKSARCGQERRDRRLVKPENVDRKKFHFLFATEDTERSESSYLKFGRNTDLQNPNPKAKNLNLRALCVLRG